MRRRNKLAVLACLAVAIAPGTWLRTYVPPPDFSAPLLVTPLSDPQEITGQVTLLGSWKLTSENAHFGGYSAMVVLNENRLLIGSDRGRILEMPLPETANPDTQVQFSFFPGTDGGPKSYADLEALEFDKGRQRIWAAFEQNGSIARFAYNAPKATLRTAKVAAMEDWPANGGPETIMRLDDGRFIVVAESSDYDSRLALMFSGDPVEGDEAIAFRFKPPAGYSPVDGTVLPDGRVLILVRKVLWGVPPQFATGLVLADPTEIAEGEEWSGELIAEIAGPDLEENFEGIAAIEQVDGSFDLYLIADDNLSAFQETLMLRLNWAPESKPNSKKARAEPEGTENAPS